MVSGRTIVQTISLRNSELSNIAKLLILFICSVTLFFSLTHLNGSLNK